MTRRDLDHTGASPSLGPSGMTFGQLCFSRPIPVGRWGFSRTFGRAVPWPPPDLELSSVNCPEKPEIDALSAQMPRKSLLEARHYTALTNFIRPRQLIDRH